MAWAALSSQYQALVKPVRQRPVSDFGKALVQLGAGSNKNLDDGDVIGEEDNMP